MAVARQLVTQAEFVAMAYHRARRKLSRGARGQEIITLTPLESATLMMVVREHDHERRVHATLGVAE